MGGRRWEVKGGGDERKGAEGAEGADMGRVSARPPPEQTPINHLLGEILYPKHPRAAHLGPRVFAHAASADSRGLPAALLSLALHPSLGIPEGEIRGSRLSAQTESR